MGILPSEAIACLTTQPGSKGAAMSLGAADTSVRATGGVVSYDSVGAGSDSG
jgi:hypothetical protein